jgi:hypothetical protein
VLLALAAAPAAAQDVPPDSVLVRAVTAALRSDLRNFITAQEAYFADHVTYAPTLPAMASLYRPSRGVTLVVLVSGTTGHSEIAIHERVPGLVCATFVGNAPAPLGRGDEGQVVCRGQPETGR